MQARDTNLHSRVREVVCKLACLVWDEYELVCCTFDLAETWESAALQMCWHSLWPRGEIPTTPHELKTEPEYFIQFINDQFRAHSDARRRLFLIFQYRYYQYCWVVVFFSLQSTASAASGKIMCYHIKTSGKSNISLLSF